jgi:hypothetical protein
MARGWCKRLVEWGRRALLTRDAGAGLGGAQETTRRRSTWLRCGRSCRASQARAPNSLVTCWCSVPCFVSWGDSYERGTGS